MLATGLKSLPMDLRFQSLRPEVIGGIALGIFAFLRIAILAWFDPFDLSPDEAHYWDWSRHLDWCYFSKGPLVAWTIRASCELFGTTPFAVRLPAALGGTLILAGVWRIAANAWNDERFALRVLLSMMPLPPIAAVSHFFTIDSPVLACWAWATVAVQRKRFGFAGVLIAVGVLAKLTMLLFPVCVLGWMLFHPAMRTKRFGLLILGGAIGLIPILGWNATNDWTSFRHLLGHSENGGLPTPWYSSLAFLGGQVGLLLGFWFVAWALAIRRFRKNSNSTEALLGFLSAPVFAVFLLSSIRTAGQVNWPVAAYLTGFPLAVRFIWDRPLLRKLAIGTSVVGLFLSIGVLFPDVFRPAMAVVLPKPREEAPTPIRRLDPTARLAGWRTLAKAVDEVREQIRNEDGIDPELGMMVWTLPGELGFYCEGHPIVYSFGSNLADRRSQYDLWRPNPLADAQAFAGKTFVYVGEKLPDGCFDEFECIRTVVAAEKGIPLAVWKIWVGRGFRGIAPRDAERPTRY